MSSNAKHIQKLIEAIVESHPANRSEVTGKAFFHSPMVGFADAADPLFASYKQVIGDFHWSPAQAFEQTHGAGSFTTGTVIVWSLPIVEATRKSNRKEKKLPSRQWAHTRWFGEMFNNAVRDAVVAEVKKLGGRGVAPATLEGFKAVKDPTVGIASLWSERHAAYAAGLGTFSLNDALITERGIAMRLGSVVTDLTIAPSEKPYAELRSNCLYFMDGSCGKCAKRCPTGAISKEGGHDKEKCRVYSYGTVLDEVGEKFGVKVAGCGLCQTAVPCEYRIPKVKSKK